MSWAVKLHGQILRVPLWSTMVSSLTALWLLHFLDARKGEDKEARYTAKRRRVGPRLSRNIILVLLVVVSELQSASVPVDFAPLSNSTRSLRLL